MTSMLSLAKTPMQAIYEATCIDLIKELSDGLVEDIPTNESYTSIHGLNHSVEEINYTKAIENIATKYHNPKLMRISGGPNTGYNDFHNEMDIMKVGQMDMSINEAIAMAAEIIKDAGTQFYGMLLMDEGRNKKKVAFNPLHPIIVSELIKEDTSIDRDKKEWTLAVFSWKDGREEYFKKKYPHYYNEESYAEEIATLIASIDTPSEYIIENKDFRVDIEHDQFVLNYEQIKRLKDSGDIIKQEPTDARSYIIPGQLINVGGVGYPYYNTIYSTKGLAWNMSPMYGANINHPQGQETRNGMMGGSRICTNSGNSKTQKGIAALNHCNTTSPLNRDCMEKGSMSYANQCIQLSLELLLGDEYGGVQEKALTFQEFVSENDGATKAQYLKYIRDRMKNMMSEEPKEKAPKQKKENVLKYKMYNGNTNYRAGDVCVDGSYDKNQWNDPRGRLRIMTKTGWEDFNKDLNDSITQVNGNTLEVFNQELVRDWQNGIAYVEGDIVYNDGKLQINQGDQNWIDFIPPIDLTDVNAQERTA